jgi:hypothetical protein
MSINIGGIQMRKEDIIRKLTSRKLWLSIANFTTMVLVYHGAAQSEAERVAAIIMAGASVLGYVLAEGLADAGNAGLPQDADDDAE